MRQLMQQYSPMQAAKMVHAYYAEHLRGQAEYEGVPEWSLWVFVCLVACASRASSPPWAASSAVHPAKWAALL